MVVAMDEFAEVRAQEAAGAAAEYLAQGRIRLKHRAFVRNQRHADRGVREGLLEAAFALLQLRQMASGLGGFALGVGDAFLLRLLGVLDVTRYSR